MVTIGYSAHNHAVHMSGTFIVAALVGVGEPSELFPLLFYEHQRRHPRNSHSSNFLLQRFLIFSH
jgi:hypothetical protein